MAIQSVFICIFMHIQQCTVYAHTDRRVIGVCQDQASVPGSATIRHSHNQSGKPPP